MDILMDLRMEYVLEVLGKNYMAREFGVSSGHDLDQS